MAEPLFIAGASVRAAAQSAWRAGFDVTAADQFCDRDLAACCQAFQVPDYPAGILPIANRLAPQEWLYSGGLENEPTLVDAVSRRHRLLGQPGSLLRQVRDPWQVAEVLARDGLRFPVPLAAGASGGPGRWVRKPLAGCGGSHIRMYDEGGPAPSPARSDSVVARWPAGMPGERAYYQPWIRGASYGAVFLAACGAARLVGVTRQLAGCVWAGASGFRYVGSIGPVNLDSRVGRELARIGSHLAAAFPLCGLFGVDTIITGQDVWTLEINPRYTASVEVLERATGALLVRLHCEICRGAPVPRGMPHCTGPMHGKAVVFARTDCMIQDAFYPQLDALPVSLGPCEFADLPQVGTAIRAGDPVLTILTVGRNERCVHRQLRTVARALHQLLAT